MKQALGLAVMVGLVLLITGCGESGTSTKADRSGSAHRNPQGEGRASAARPASDAPGSGPQTIPGMNADAVAAIFLKPGLECFDPVDRDVLYACSSEDNHDLHLLYDGKVMGHGADLVSTVWARVAREENSGGFGLASQPFFGLLSAQLEYRGADKKRAYEFVSRNLNSTRANTTIGAAEWTITTSRDSKTLLVTPEK
jgi:hypothetical protein